jgi:hypothetical protein
LLTRALKLHEAGRNREAHKLTMQAANFLEDAVAVEGFRLGLDRKAGHKTAMVSKTEKRR